MGGGIGRRGIHIKTHYTVESGEGDELFLSAVKNLLTVKKVNTASIFFGIEKKIPYPTAYRKKKSNWYYYICFEE
jgi:hypothetical protein